MPTSQFLQAPTAADVYHDLRETAAILRCSVRTVRRLLASGRLGYSQEKKGGIIRVSDADIAAYYDASRVGPRVPAQRGRARAAA